jgi:hypothetical protein
MYKCKDFIYKKIFLDEDIEDLLILLSVKVNRLINELKNSNEDREIIIKYYMRIITDINTNIQYLIGRYNINRNKVIKKLKDITEQDSKLTQQICFYLLDNKINEVLKLVEETQCK